MYRETSITLSHEEVLKMGGVDQANIDHKRDETSPTGTGIRPIFRGFYTFVDRVRTDVDAKVVKNRILEHLKNEGIIEGDQWMIEWKTNHQWGAFDDDGYGSSIYTVRAKVHKGERL